MLTLAPLLLRTNEATITPNGTPCADASGCTPTYCYDVAVDTAVKVNDPTLLKSLNYTVSLMSTPTPSVEGVTAPYNGVCGPKPSSDAKGPCDGTLASLYPAHHGDLWATTSTTATASLANVCKSGLYCAVTTISSSAGTGVCTASPTLGEPCVNPDQFKKATGAWTSAVSRPPICGPGLVCDTKQCAATEATCGLCVLCRSSTDCTDKEKCYHINIDTKSDITTVATFSYTTTVLDAETDGIGGVCGPAVNPKPGQPCDFDDTKLFNSSASLTKICQANEYCFVTVDTGNNKGKTGLCSPLPNANGGSCVAPDQFRKGSSLHVPSIQPICPSDSKCDTTAGDCKPVNKPTCGTCTTSTTTTTNAPSPKSTTSSKDPSGATTSIAAATGFIMMLATLIQ